MKKIVSLVFVAFLGGAISLAGFSYLVKSQNYGRPQVSEVENNFIPIPTSYPSIPSVAGENTDFVDAASKSLNAVVHVKNTSTSTYHDPFSDFFYGRGNGYSRERESVGTGSGVLISKDGYIVTNNHVIEGAQSIEISTNDNKTYSAEIIGTDSNTDIALLKIEPLKSLKYLTFR